MQSVDSYRFQNVHDNMRLISAEEIEQAMPTPDVCVQWVKESFLMKDKCVLPPKISLHPRGDDFINTMPCLLPESYLTYGCKIVSRVAGQHPVLKSEISIVDTSTGAVTHMLNGDFITSRRTGAVAALAINTLRSSHAEVYSFIGLGVIGHSTLECLIATNKDRKMRIRLMRYKDHAERMARLFSGIDNVDFEFVDTIEQLVDGADVVVSAITSAEGLLVEDTSLFKKGVLVVPVHTRGFQNCDLVFDKVFGDDTAHIRDFRYFDKFRSFAELGDVLSGKVIGRENDSQRILSYNIGLAIHDILYARKLIAIIEKR